MRTARNNPSAKKSVRSDDRASRAFFGAIAAAFGIFGAVQFIRPALATWRAVDWTIVATGEVAGGPSLRDELPVPVQPADPATP